MSKFLVLSDSHGRSGKVKKILAAHQDADGILYLGDGEKDLAAALAAVEQKLPVYQVRGNCDRDSCQAVTLVKEIDGVRFYITHGYEQGVKYGLEKLVRLAKEEGCAAALFGHTHGAHLSEMNGVTLFNPGSAANGSYGVIQIEKGKAAFQHFMI